MKAEYARRISDKILVEKLESSGAVLIEGTKWCGKTRTALEASKSHIFIQDPDMWSNYSTVADSKPSMLLVGDKPRLLDEWQDLPVLWDAVRHDVDMSGEKGSYILTGSAVPSDNVVKHTGTGRISRMVMRPMSLFESQESNGTISLQALFDGKLSIESFSNLSIEKLVFATVRGGWPASIGETEKVALRLAKNYVEAIINKDASRIDGVDKNPSRIRALLHSLARNVSTLANIKTIYDDIAQTSGATLSEKTISLYLNALSRIFVIDDIPAWSPALRSKTTIRTSSKRQFVDPSIATAVMRLTPKSVLNDFNYFGFLFESLCDRDLRVYSEAIDGNIYHYRDANGLEADAIISLNDGRWAAVEIKLGSKAIDKAAENLLKLTSKINTEKMREPSFLMVLTATEFAYRRNDGVFVVPIGCLKD